MPAVRRWAAAHPLPDRSLELLARNRRPLPDTFHGVTDQETRYRRRYLDLLMNDDAI